MLFKIDFGDFSPGFIENSKNRPQGTCLFAENPKSGLAVIDSGKKSENIFNLNIMISG